MKVADLIEALQCYDPQAEVHFTYNYGDHWRTQVAPSVSSVDSGYVKFSDYHRMDKITDDEDEIYTEDGRRDLDIKEVVVLG